MTQPTTTRIALKDVKAIRMVCPKCKRAIETPIDQLEETKTYPDGKCPVCMAQVLTVDDKNKPTLHRLAAVLKEIEGVDVFLEL
jgi:hypothetical protein